MKLLLILPLLPAFTIARTWPPRQPFQFQDIDYIYQPTLRDFQADKLIGGVYSGQGQAPPGTTTGGQWPKDAFNTWKELGVLPQTIYQPAGRDVQAGEMAGGASGQGQALPGTTTGGQWLKDVFNSFTSSNFGKTILIAFNMDQLFTVPV